MIALDAGGPRVIGNFQPGSGTLSAGEAWAEAARFIIVAQGAFYLVSAANPRDYVAGPEAVGAIRVTPDRQRLVVADACELLCYDSQGRLVWRRQDLAVDGIELTAVSDHVVCGRACNDPPDEWAAFRIRSADGSDA